MRKNVKSLAPTLWFVIAAFIISIFAVWGGAGRLGESRAANIIATVGREKISTSLYYQSLRQRLEAMKREFKDLDSNFIQQLNIPQQILEQIIQQALVLQISRDMGIRATDEEIREKIKSYPVFQKDGKFIGFEEYQRILEWNRMSISDFEENLKKEVVMEKTINVLTSGIAVTQEELWESYKNNNESAKLEYVVLELNKIEWKEDVQPSEIQDSFNKNREKYRIPEKREGDFIFFNTEEFINTIQPDESNIEKYYKDNQSQFQEPEKIKISRIYLPFESKEKELVLTEAQNISERAKKGEDFGDLAKNYSKDEKAKENGDWGLYDWKRLSSKEQEEIRGLSNGELSAPLEVENGVSILKVTEKEPPIQKSLESVKEKIISILKDQTAREAVEKKAAQFEKAARKEKSVDAAAQKLGYGIKKTGLLKEGEALKEIDTSGSISSALFQLKEQEISSVLYTYKGAGIVQLTRIEPPRLASFEEVKEEVKEELIDNKKKEMALEQMKKIKEELKKSSLEVLAEKYDLEYKTGEEHKRGQYLSIIGENPEVDRAAFTLPLGQASDPVPIASGYTLIRIQDRKEVTQEDFDKVKNTERENLLETKKNKYLQSILSKWREEIGVKIKYDLFLKINSDVLSRFEGEK